MFGIRFGILGRVGFGWADFWICGPSGEIWDSMGMVLVALLSWPWLAGWSTFWGGAGLAFCAVFFGIGLGGLACLLLLLL